MPLWRRRKENLGVFSLYAKRYKSMYISVNNNTNLNLFKILSNYIMWDRLSQKTISRYCPFKGTVASDFLLKNLLRSVFILRPRKYCNSKFVFKIIAEIFEFFLADRWKAELDQILILTIQYNIIYTKYYNTIEYNETRAECPTSGPQVNSIWSCTKTRFVIVICVHFKKSNI